jgi:uncharacterized membrane protein SpoIIM required for sporulation
VTPLRFEAQYAPLWDELQSELDRIESGGARRDGDAARLAQLYRGCCEHLALSQERAYPIRLVQRLQSLAYRAHRVIYRRQDFGAGRLRQLVLVQIPEAVRLHRRYFLVALALLWVPTLLAAWATWRDPAFALRILEPGSLDEFRRMYGGEGQGLGPHGRGASGDLGMFGYYVMHNISLGFQCFAGGLFAGLGSALFLVYNGLFGGAVAGYVTASGHALNFYSFVVTHSAFELTAICLSGAAGLRIGHSWIAPGRRTRLEALKHASAEAVVLIYAVFVFLLVAAAIEAFWSSAPWVAPRAKFTAGALAWSLVIAYLWRQGRPPPRPDAGTSAPGATGAH